MSPHAWWYLARATGYVAWALVTASVVTGLLLGGRLAKRRPTPAWTLDLHRFLGGTAVVVTALHLAGLVADDYVHFGAAEVLVPFASSWRPGAVALGVIGLYLLAAVEVSSLLMRRIPRRVWRSIHLTSYVLFWTATFHLLTAGTDATNPVSRIVAALAVIAVVFLTLVRSFAGRRGRRQRARPGIRATAMSHPTVDHAAVSEARPAG
jgi:predicted ferric reductase